MSSAVTRVTLKAGFSHPIAGVTHHFGAGQHFLPEHVADAARAAGLLDDADTLAPAKPAPPKPKRVRKPKVRPAKAAPAKPA